LNILEKKSPSKVRHCIFHKKHSKRVVHSVISDPNYPKAFWQIRYLETCNVCSEESIITDMYPLSKKRDNETSNRILKAKSHEGAVEFAEQRLKKQQGIDTNA